MSSNRPTTGKPLGRRSDVKRPNLNQVIIQLGLVALVLAIWGGLLAGVVSLTGGARGEEIAEATSVPDTPTLPPADTALPPTEEPTATETLAPTDTALPPTPTLEPEGTEPVAPTSEPTEEEPTATEPVAPTSEPTEEEPTATEEPSPTMEPSPTEEPTATQEPVPTETPIPEDTPLPAGVSFAQDVLPIFENRCNRCHGADDPEYGLGLYSYEALMAGSQDGQVIVPFDADLSLLVEEIVSGSMPKRGPRLLPGQIETIMNWINEGALDN